MKEAQKERNRRGLESKKRNNNFHFILRCFSLLSPSDSHMVGCNILLVLHVLCDSVSYIYPQSTLLPLSSYVHL